MRKRESRNVFSVQLERITVRSLMNTDQPTTTASGVPETQQGHTLDQQSIRQFEYFKPEDREFIIRCVNRSNHAEALAEALRILMTGMPEQQPWAESHARAVLERWENAQ